MAKLCHNKISAGILLYAQMGNILIKAAGFKMLFRISGHGNAELWKRFFYKSDQLVGIIKISEVPALRLRIRL